MKTELKEVFTYNTIEYDQLEQREKRIIDNLISELKQLDLEKQILQQEEPIVYNIIEPSYRFTFEIQTFIPKDLSDKITQVYTGILFPDSKLDIGRSSISTSK